jgi:hypothetical protein
VSSELSNIEEVISDLRETASAASLNGVATTDTATSEGGRAVEDFRLTLRRKLPGHRVAQQDLASVLRSRCQNGLKGVFWSEPFSRPS